MISRSLVVSFAFLALASSAYGAEGMFRLDKLPTEALRKAGLRATPGKLLELSRAVVRVAHGGSGSFVSGDGLLVTNYHVAYRCLVRLDSMKEHHGLVERGFLASSRKDELHCPGYDLLVVERVSDVTAEVNAAVTAKMSWSARFEAIRLKKQDIVDRCQQSKRFICSVAAMDGGRAYTLTVQRRIRDVRLVYTPPKDLGKYGGDIDNWMYPRHTADFTFLRAYVGADGRERSYDKANVPLRTPVHLRVSTKGVRRGELTIVIGFPGRTSRHVTTHAVRFFTDVRVPAVRAVLGEVIGKLNGWMKKDPDTRRKYAGLEAGLQNALKYYQMIAKGMRQFRVLESKIAEEKRLIAALKKGSEAWRNARRLLPQIASIYKGAGAYNDRLTTLLWLTTWGSPSAAMAYDMVSWSIEKQKPNRMRKKQRYKDKNVLYFVHSARRFERETNLATERALLTLLLTRNAKEPRAKRIKAIDTLLAWARKRQRAIEKEAKAKKRAFVARFFELYGVKPPAEPLARAVVMMLGDSKLFSRSSDPLKIRDAVAFRDRVFKMNFAELKKLGDPLLVFAIALEHERRAIEEGPLKRVTELLATSLHPQWVAQVKRATYPDANSTVRLSYGTVQDYTNTETKVKHRYITDLAGLLAKAKGAFPFRVPAFLRAAAPTAKSSPFADKTIGDVPINFTNTLDTTGGNSGSPVLNADGELVGLLFDGTPEAVISDWLYIAKDQRSICVDIRYALYLASLAKATPLLRELGVPLP